ncbi:MAG: gephyrin-like molybdotransferase Glp [Candidatus Ventricola sp.]
MKETMAFTAACDLLLGLVSPVGTERAALHACAGRVLAQDLIAAENIPPFDRSPYDGYAFRSQDTQDASKAHPVTLAILEEVPAGAVPAKTVTAGTATKILTGAPIPPGADCVCMYEKTAFTKETVTLFAPMHPGDNVVRAGEDVKKGAELARRGDVIDTGIAGTLCAQGEAFPQVYRRLRVGIVSTGNEVVEADAALMPGKIRNSNRHALETALIREGMEPVYLGLAGDDTDNIARLIEQGLFSCDAVLLTGGVSVGDYDLTPAAMESAGVPVLVRGVDLKPGMACAYGVKGGRPVCALSGNPASALTNFYCIALPVLRKLAGRNDPIPPEITVTLKNGFRKKSPGTRVLRGRLDLSDGTVRMVLPDDQGNVVLSSTIGCNVMAIVPAGSGALPEGTVLKGFVL